MKRISVAAILLIALALISCLCSCGTIRESIDITYGEQKVIENEQFSKYDNITWKSSDESVVSVSDGSIEALSPGVATVTASADENDIAEYNVSVSIIPIDSLVLSADACELAVGRYTKLNYTLYPDNASEYGLEWKSADESVATANQLGRVVAIKPGQTTVSISVFGRLLASCSVTVTEKAAYDRLKNSEKKFVDACLKHISAFKNPDSVIIKEISNRNTYWLVEISAQNGFGGNSTNVYVLSNESGFDEAKGAGIYVSFTDNFSYDIDLINRAIDERR